MLEFKLKINPSPYKSKAMRMSRINEAVKNGRENVLSKEVSNNVKKNRKTGNKG